MNAILWYIGLILSVGFGARVLFRLSIVLGLIGAKKFGTEKGEQIEENRKNLKIYKAQLLYALIGLAVGLLLLFFTNNNF